MNIGDFSPGEFRLASWRVGFLSKAFGFQIKYKYGQTVREELQKAMMRRALTTDAYRVYNKANRYDSQLNTKKIIIVREVNLQVVYKDIKTEI